MVVDPCTGPGHPTSLRIFFRVELAQDAGPRFNESSVLRHGAARNEAFLLQDVVLLTNRVVPNDGAVIFFTLHLALHLSTFDEKWANQTHHMPGRTYRSSTWCIGPDGGDAIAKKSAL